LFAKGYGKRDWRGLLVQHEEDLKERDEGQRKISDDGKTAKDFQGKINPFTIEPKEGQSSGQAKTDFQAEQAEHDPNGRNVTFQARHMANDLTPYSKIVLYLSIPPVAYVGWIEAVMTQWATGKKGKDRIHILLEKPFGSSEKTAEELHDKIATLGGEGWDTSSHLHLVDHFKSFFMFRQWATWQPYLYNLMNIKWNKEDDNGDKAIKKIVVKQFEERGLEGRGGFFDRAGQVRDMVQSHLLQVLIQVMAPNADAAKKRDILRSLAIKNATYGQYDGFLDEDGLQWHEDFAAPTLCRVEFTSHNDNWKDVALVIETGKDFKTKDDKDGKPGTRGNMYDVEIYLDKYSIMQEHPDLIYQYGVEETKTAQIKVWDISLIDYGRVEGKKDIKVPLPQGEGSNLSDVRERGNVLFTYYTEPASCKKTNSKNIHCGYYPGAYAMMMNAAVKDEWEAGFVTFEECDASWKILQGKTAPGKRSPIMEPAPEDVYVYKPPVTCGHENPPYNGWNPKECYDDPKRTVKDLYVDEFACKNWHERTNWQVKKSRTALWNSHCENKETGTNLLVEGSGPSHVLLA
jgi:glucose-6-phosphate 1-dehydrogenase